MEYVSQGDPWNGQIVIALSFQSWNTYEKMLKEEKYLIFTYGVV